MRLSAGTISVLPPPRDWSMVAMARSMLARVAGTGRSLSIWLLPENSSTLKVSVGRRWPIRLRSSTLAVLSGWPCIEPEMSTTNTYSRGLICAVVIARGGSTTARKKFSWPAASALPSNSSPRKRISPVAVRSPARR